MDSYDREPRGVVEEPKSLSSPPHTQGSPPRFAVTTTGSGKDRRTGSPEISSAMPQEPPPALIQPRQQEDLQAHPRLPRPLSMPLSPNATQNTGATTSTQTRVSSGNLGHQVASTSSKEKLLESRTPSMALDHHQSYGRERDPEALERDRDMERLGHGRIRRDSRGTALDAPLPALPRTGSDYQGLRRARTIDEHGPSRQRSGLDWIVPIDEKSAVRSRTVAARLQPTIDTAKENRDKYAKKAMYTGYILNLAIGLQVLLGSLTTGLSALSSNGRGFAIQTTILGGMTTMIAGYLARTRGSNEPELSTSRVKDLDKYIRETTAFVLDFGDSDDPKHDDRIQEFRNEFEELLGNGSGERKLAGPLQAGA